MNGLRERRATVGATGLIGVAGAALAAVLVAFHGQLLWQRLADGSLLEPVVAIRWLLGALLTAALGSLWRRGLPLFRGRRAAVVWLVALLLHAGVPGGSMPAVAPAASALLALPAILAALCALRAVGAGSGPAALGGPRSFRRRDLPALRRPAGWSPSLFCRPPPFSPSF